MRWPPLTSSRTRRGKRCSRAGNSAPPPVQSPRCKRSRRGRAGLTAPGRGAGGGGGGGVWGDRVGVGVGEGPGVAKGRATRGNAAGGGDLTADRNPHAALLPHLAIEINLGPLLRGIAGSQAARNRQRRVSF